MHLLLVDTAQIQPYVFGSNRLRENIGASYLVAQATESWSLATLRQVAPRSNVRPNGSLDGSAPDLSGARLDAEVLFAGGGNFAALFGDDGQAAAFTRALTRKVLSEAPNLQIVITRRTFESTQSLAMVLDEAFQDMACAKRARIPSAPLLGLGVTAACQSTGLPAVGLAQLGPDESSTYLASAEVLAKLDVVRPHSRAADDRLARDIPPPDGCDYPSEFDDLGRSTGHRSYLAVVHADGDGLGDRMQKIAADFQEPGRNDEYVQELRRFSQAVKQAGQEALRQTLAELAACVQPNGWILHRDAMGKEIARIELAQREDGAWLLPFRPIVFGGDDVTFVCDGRLGVSLAVAYLRAFERCSAKLLGEPNRLTASAGIAIVKIHYPFARAYGLAEELCQSAKQLRREIKRTNPDWIGSCLDWHFALSGLAGSIEQIRAREYFVGEGRLCLRPVTLSENPKNPQHAWPVVMNGIAAFQGREWAGRRNKIKALREALREGPAAVRQFLAHFNEGRDLPEVEPSLTDFPKSGWQLQTCGYFDAVELADWVFPLEGGSNG